MVGCALLPRSDAQFSLRFPQVGLHRFSKFLMVFHRQPVPPAVPAGEDQAVRAAAVRFPIAVEKRDFFLRCVSGKSNGINLTQRQYTGGAHAGADDNFPAVKYNAAADGGNEFRRDKAEAHNP